MTGGSEEEGEAGRWGWQSDLGVSPLMFNALGAAAGERRRRQSGNWEQQRRVWLLWAIVDFFLIYFFVGKDINSALMEETHSHPPTTLYIFKTKIVNNHLEFTFSILQSWMHSLTTLLDEAFSRLLLQTARQPIARQRLAWQQLCAFGEVDRQTEWEKKGGFEWRRRMWLFVPDGLLV